jgi:thiosulfate dehydrogenase (quinone) large subunit
MKNTNPTQYRDTQRWQPPQQTIEHRQDIDGNVGTRLPWFVGVPREPGRIPAAFILPARIFLAITYLYAGIQKFTDPQFFSPTAPGFVGEEMRGYVRSGSPLSPLLTHLVIPHAAFVGGVIALCELLVGLSALTGLLTRAGAIGGVAISLIFYLTASWAVHPYFLGGDLPYALVWLTLALAGPGPYSLDEYFFGAVVRGRAAAAAIAATRPPRRATAQRATNPPYPAPPVSPAPSDAMTRAALLRGFGTAALLAVGAGIAGAIAKARTPSGVYSAQANLDGDAPAAGATATPPPAATPGVASSGGGAFTIPPFRSSAAAATATAAPGAQSDTAATPTTAPLPRTTPPVAPSTSAVLANTSSFPANSAARFTDPSSGGPALLIHLADGSVVAYSAICTHSGCTVQYSATQKQIVCPCHGAVFDPAHNAQVVRGPARRPLAAIPVQVDGSGNVSLKSGGA